MMELHEENKLLREALAYLSNPSAAEHAKAARKGFMMGDRTAKFNNAVHMMAYAETALATVGPAAQPEGVRLSAADPSASDQWSTGQQAAFSAALGAYESATQPEGDEPDVYDAVRQFRDKQTETVCTLPPHGWYCTRAPGHEGPCAAVAQPTESEGEAAPSTVDEDKLRELLVRYTVAAPGDATKAARESIVDSINAWHQSKLAEAIERAVLLERRIVGLASDEQRQRTEKAEAALTAIRTAGADGPEIAYKALSGKPAPQAGDALDDSAMFESWAQSHGGFPLFKHEEHLCERELVYPATYFNYVTEMAWRAWANKPSNASRREACDKGRAEGVGEAVREEEKAVIARAAALLLSFADTGMVHIGPDGTDTPNRIYCREVGQALMAMFSADRATPPASAAQQVPK